MVVKVSERSVEKSEDLRISFIQFAGENKSN